LGARRQTDRQEARGTGAKFGKKPNITYILADDVGWGEMGWQGGGKHRGTPTPELDKLTSGACTSGKPKM